MNVTTASIEHALQAVKKKWSFETVRPNEPLSRELVIEAFQRMGLEPTQELIEVFTVLNGFHEGYMDDECIEFWSLPKIVDKYKKGSDLVAFADFLIDAHRYAFAVGVEPIPVYMVCGKLAGDRIADSIADFFQRYLYDPSSIV